MLNRGALFRTTQKCLTGLEQQLVWATVLGQSPAATGDTVWGHCGNLDTSRGLFSYSSSISGLKSTILPIASSICFDMVLCDTIPLLVSAAASHHTTPSLAL